MFDVFNMKNPQRKLTREEARAIFLRRNDPNKEQVARDLAKKHGFGSVTSIKKIWRGDSYWADTKDLLETECED